MEFCNILDAYMRKLGITNYQLSKSTGISDSLIGYWRTGKRKPTLDNLLILSNHLNVSIDFLVKGENNSSILLEYTSKLTPDEQELLKTYKELDRRGQHRIHTVIYEELDRIEKKNYSSS